MQPTVLAIFLAALSMLGPFSIDTIFPAFPPIGKEFAADPVAMQQTISVYLISYAVMSLFLLRAGGWRGIFWSLALTAALNFGALFLYIASTPAFVLGLLRLPATGFPWLFVPLITGLTGGAWVSGRVAGRISASHAINIGFTGIASRLALGMASLSAAALIGWRFYAAGSAPEIPVVKAGDQGLDLEVEPPL